RFAQLVRDLDVVLASNPKAVDPITKIFHDQLPIANCRIEEVLAIARASPFFVGSEEAPEYYNIAFNSAATSTGYGFAVLIALNKKSMSLELPFAIPNQF